jgi:hypothetical protein
MLLQLFAILISADHLDTWNIDNDDTVVVKQNLTSRICSNKQFA